MANLAPYSWDTDAIETDPLAIDVTDRLFPPYVKDVVFLSFGPYFPKLYSDEQFHPRSQTPKVRIYTHARRRNANLRPCNLLIRLRRPHIPCPPTSPLPLHPPLPHTLTPRHFRTQTSPLSSFPTRKRKEHWYQFCWGAAADVC